MTNEAAIAMRDLLLNELRHEYALTRKVLAALPAETASYKPSEKCMSGLELASHIATSETFFLRGVIDGAFEWKPQEFATPAAVLEYYDRTVPALFDELAALPAEKLAQPVKFAMFEQPMVTYLMFDLKHGIHHRGQLSSYLRPMGAKVPGIYGPSADEGMSEAAAN